MMHAAPKVEELREFDWNFERVPDSELVACCYWEYARESAFILGVRERCLDPKWKNMVNSEFWEYCGKDMAKIQSMGYANEVFLNRFFFEPGNNDQDADRELPNFRQPSESHLTGSFPHPWQSLSAEERKERSRIRSDRTAIPLLPFKRGMPTHAQDISQHVKMQRANAEAERERVRRENPRVREKTLVRLGKLEYPQVKPSVFLAGGREVTMVEINWAEFTNDEIATYFRRWVKANRPKDVAAPSAKGHKPKDWRAKLTRLAVMRLLARFRLSDIVTAKQAGIPAVWESKQFAGQKWFDTTKWYDARRKAGRCFRSLFPFLPADEKPISWVKPSPAK
jgi:hypothetical protein